MFVCFQNGHYTEEFAGPVVDGSEEAEKVSKFLEKESEVFQRPGVFLPENSEVNQPNTNGDVELHMEPDLHMEPNLHAEPEGSMEPNVPAEPNPPMEPDLYREPGVEVSFVLTAVVYFFISLVLCFNLKYIRLEDW